MSNVANETIYSTEVIEIGSEAKNFKAVNMLIFFGSQAPNELRSSCFIVNVEPVKSEIKPGMTLTIGDNSYEITSVGTEVMQNLQKLGHIAVKFTGDTSAELPGSLYVEKREFPDISVGDKVTIG